MWPCAFDYVPGPFDPLMAIQRMVTRKDDNGNVRGPTQRITIDEQVTVATIDGALARRGNPDRRHCDAGVTRPDSPIAEGRIARSAPAVLR